MLLTARPSPDSDRLQLPVVLAVGADELEEALRQSGLQPRLAHTVEAALAELASRVPRATVFHVSALGERELREVYRACRREAPLTEVLVWAPGASAEFVRRAMRAGIDDVVLDTGPEAVAEAVRRVVDDQRMLPRVQRLSRARERARFEGLVSRSAELWEVFETSIRVAPTEASVLILGETGTGKELLARAIHKHSGRAGRFVALDCGAVPETLIEAELFGHEKGAFTGAVRAKRGLFRHADGGTLFLDEVGNLSAAAQFSLLRVLQEGAVRPLGGSDEIPVDVRVIAATSTPLDTAVEEGSFREDLLYRLDVIRLVLPPLRERPEDVLYLFGHFRKQLSRHHKLEPPRLSEDFLEAMLAYDWPGNVRELENFTERLILTKSGASLREQHFAKLKRPYRRGGQEAPPAAGPAPDADPAPVDLSRPLQELVEPAVEELERRYLRAALHRTRGRIQAAAELAGLSRRTLLRKLKRYGIDKQAFR